MVIPLRFLLTKWHWPNRQQHRCICWSPPFLPGAFLPIYCVIFPFWHPSLLRSNPWWPIPHIWQHFRFSSFGPSPPQSQRTTNTAYAWRGPQCNGRSLIAFCPTWLSPNLRLLLLFILRFWKMGGSAPTTALLCLLWPFSYIGKIITMIFINATNEVKIGNQYWLCYKASSINNSNTGIPSQMIKYPNPSN